MPRLSQPILQVREAFELEQGTILLQGAISKFESHRVVIHWTKNLPNSILERVPE